MVTFSLEEYSISIYTGEPPVILEHYLKHALFVDDKGLANDGTAVYIIIATRFPHEQYVIIAFRSFPVDCAGFHPELLYENTSQTLFIGAGTVVKVFNIADKRIVFEKDAGVGFLGWNKYKSYIVQQEELTVGIFDLQGKQLWQTDVEPPYNLDFDGDILTLKFNDKVERRLLGTGILT